MFLIKFSLLKYNVFFLIKGKSAIMYKYLHDYVHDN